MNYQTKALFSAEDKIKFKLTLFNTEMENLIGGGPGGGQTVFNLPTLISKGLEARVNYKLNSKLETTLAFTDTQVEDKDGNVYISARFNRHAANAGQRLVWNNKWFPTSSLFLGYTLRASMDVNDVPDGEEPRKGYVIHDIQATWNPKFLQSAEISLIANNLFDKAYREATTLGNTDEQRVYEPGRNIRLMATYTF